MMQVIEQTHEEKVKMYMKAKKIQLVEMLIECNRILEAQNQAGEYLAQPYVSRQLPSVYDLDIQMLRNTATDAEFRRKIQQWLEGNFG